MKRVYFHTAIVVSQLILDYLTVVVSFLLGYYTYHFTYVHFQIGVGVQPFKIYRNLALGSGFLFLVIFERFGLYSRKVGVLNVEEIKRILQSILIGSLILFSLSFLLRPVFPASNPGLQIDFSRGSDFANPPEMHNILLYSRLILLYSLIFLLFLLNIQRSLVNRILLKMHLKGPGLNRVLIYGAGEVGRQLHRRLSENPRIGMKPIGFLDDDLNKVGETITGIAGQKDTAVKVLGNGLQLPDIVRAWDIHEVIIAIPTASTARIYEIINTCVQVKVKFSFVPNLFDMFIQHVRFEEIEGIPLLRMKSVRKSYIYLTAKRVFDICFAGVLLVLSLPLWPLIILGIKLDSKGPAIFRQKRVGKDGKIFTIYKFRSMHVAANTYQNSPQAGNDPRITRFGRFLRRWNIDEIPQFINVLAGDMSIVGPRPEMAFKVEKYTPLQRERLKVRPGITGIWQVSSARSMEIQENLDYDFYYTENQSFLLDIVVIVKTIMAAFRGRGI